MSILLVATNNAGKVREYRSVLAGLPLELQTLAEAGVTTGLVETGSTFRENALLKAVAACRLSGLLTLADDSGLEVDALGGEPGVFSARFGGEGLTDEQRYTLLLSRLDDVPWEQRTARFRAVIALAWPTGRVEWCEGKIEGLIARAPRGRHGFGYDPVFYLPDRGQTMAELTAEVKNAISHRARAGQCARAVIERWLQAQ